MPFKEHILFAPPADGGASLFRYVDFAKLVSLLHTRTLYFARSDRLGDEFEGSMTRLNLKLRPQLFAGIPEEHWGQITEARRRSRQWTFINCWTASPSESIAMWRVYVGHGNGLAIESTYDRLIGALAGEKDVFVGMVRYADWANDVVGEGNTLAPYLVKRAGFDYERELRAVIQDMPVSDGKVDWSQPAPDGLAVPVDINQLIARIRLSPVAAGWYRDAAATVLDSFGCTVDVVQSDLSGEPVY